MFIRSSQHNAALDEEIEAALAELNKLRGDPDKYAAALDRITKLQKLKSDPGLRPPTMDTVLIVAANIFGILRLTAYEHEHNITSKALGFVFRLK